MICFNPDAANKGNISVPLEESEDLEMAGSLSHSESQTPQQSIQSI